MPLQYAEQFGSGGVNDTGSSITLSVGPSQDQSLETITYNPLAAATQSSTIRVGAGMTFQVAFSGVPSGQDVHLTVWMQGMATTPVVLGSIYGSTQGYLSMPVLSLDSNAAGTTAQNATISLGGTFGGLAGAPFNGVGASSPATNVPILGFTLTGDVTSTVSVTVSAMNQFYVGTGPA